MSLLCNSLAGMTLQWTMTVYKSIDQRSGSNAGWQQLVLQVCLLMDP